MNKLLILVLLSVVLILSGCQEPNIEADSTGLFQVESKSEFKSRIYIPDKKWFGIEVIKEVEVEVEKTVEVASDIIDTNEQVVGVSESNIVKTNGEYIFYTPKTDDILKIYSVSDTIKVELYKELEFDDFNTNEMYLTDNKLILIGTDWKHNNAEIIVLTLENFEIEYKLEVDGSLEEHRLIDDSLFFVVNQPINNDDRDMRPKMEITIGQDKESVYTSYEEIKGFIEDEEAHNVSIFASLNLKSYKLNKETFLGRINHIYMSKDALYATKGSRVREEIEKNKALIHYETRIMKFDVDSENSELNYSAVGRVGGYVLNQFSMDEYNGQFRIAT
ncbi:beta-propeller domain-containing protein [Mycoplasmatota bacterium zrk1]